MTGELLCPIRAREAPHSQVLTMFSQVSAYPLLTLRCPFLNRVSQVQILPCRSPPYLCLYTWIESGVGEWGSVTGVWLRLLAASAGLSGGRARARGLSFGLIHGGLRQCVSVRKVGRPGGEAFRGPP
jgi:hypothetical protein